MDGELLERQYRNHLSGYLKWESLPHAGDWLLFEKNIGAYVGIDEVCLSRGELYTILINKEKTGRSGSIIAIVKGTDVRSVTSVLLRFSRRRRFQVREITMDMAPNMEQIARVCFPAARRVTDRFHVQKLAFEALQEMRVKARWEALDKESIQIAYAKACGRYTMPRPLRIGDSRKQLLCPQYLSLYKKSHYGRIPTHTCRYPLQGISRPEEGILSFHEARVDISPVQAQGHRSDKTCQMV